MKSQIIFLMMICIIIMSNNIIAKPNDDGKLIGRRAISEHLNRRSFGHRTSVHPKHNEHGQGCGTHECAYDGQCTGISGCSSCAGRYCV